MNLVTCARSRRSSTWAALPAPRPPASQPAGSVAADPSARSATSACRCSTASAARVQLTSEGEDLLRRSRRLLAEVEVARRAGARAQERAKAGILRVGATPQVIENLLAAFLVALSARPPRRRSPFGRGRRRAPARPPERGDVHLASCRRATRASKARLLYPMHASLLPSAHRLARRPCSSSPSSRTSPCCCCNAGSARASGSRSRATSRICGPRAAGERRAAHAGRAGGDRIRDRGPALKCPRAGRRHPRRSAGSSRRVGRPMGDIAWDPQRFVAPYAEHFVTELVAHCGATSPAAISSGARRRWRSRQTTRSTAARACPIPSESGHALCLLICACPYRRTGGPLHRDMR